MCVSAVVLTLGGDDIEKDDVQIREQVDSERVKVEVGEKTGQRETRNRPTNARSNM